MGWPCYCYSTRAVEFINAFSHFAIINIFLSLYFSFDQYLQDQTSSSCSSLLVAYPVGLQSMTEGQQSAHTVTSSFQDGQVLSPSVNVAFDSLPASTADSMAVNHSPVVIDYDHGRAGSGGRSFDLSFADPQNLTHFHNHVHSHSFEGLANGVSVHPHPPSSCNTQNLSGNPTYGFNRPTFTSTPIPIPMPIHSFPTRQYTPLISIGSPQCNGVGYMPQGPVPLAPARFTFTPGQMPTQVGNMYTVAGGQVQCPSWPPTNPQTHSTSHHHPGSLNCPVAPCNIAVTTTVGATAASVPTGVDHTNQMVMSELSSRIFPQMETPMDTTNNATISDSSLMGIEQMLYKVSF